MRTKSTGGFTLIELLIVIAIIGILAAVLIPNLLTARSRAFDTAAQTCLKEIATHEEMAASVSPWEYTNGRFAQEYDANGSVTIGTPPDDETFAIGSCANIIVENNGSDRSGYNYIGSHGSGANTYRVQSGGGVVVHATGSTLDPTP